MQSIVTLSVFPCNTSSPLPPCKVSSPAPPFSTSSPAPPRMVSSPTPPCKVSSPSPPSIVSFPFPPSIKSFPLPPLMTSSPASARSQLSSSEPVILSSKLDPRTFSISLYVSPSAKPPLPTPFWRSTSTASFENSGRQSYPYLHRRLIDRHQHHRLANRCQHRLQLYHHLDR